MHQHLLTNIPAKPTTVPEMVDYIIGKALHHKASDIHLGINQVANPQPPHLLRFRIFGKLQLLRSDFLVHHYKEVVSRIKVLAGMNITETGVPQDGQIQVATPDGQQIVLRVSTVPGSEFEDVVIRVQKSGNQNHSLKNLQVTPSLRQKLDELIHQKSGMIILNGPAGSGKTTTIYSILGSLAGPDRKIITAEDPIEARLPFVGHTQVSAKSNFASLARAFMRQDAEVIFIGEIRDRESAEAAIQLAQTGHLVLSTLHTRDSIGVISRLEALDIHPNMIATTLIASLSQRLLPKLCSECRVPFAPSQRMAESLHQVMAPPPGAVYFKTGKGCPKCLGGIQGRQPIFELFVADPELSDMINSRCSKAEILRSARSKGLKTLAEDAATHVYDGTADLEAAYGYIVGPQNEAPRTQVVLNGGTSTDAEGSSVLKLADITTVKKTAGG